MSKPYEIAPPIADQLMRDIYELAVRSEARGGDCFDLMCLMDQAGGVDAGIRKLIDMVRARDARLSVKKEAHQAAIEQMHFHEARADKLENVNKSLSERLSVTMAIEECNDKIIDGLRSAESKVIQLRDYPKGHPVSEYKTGLEIGRVDGWNECIVAHGAKSKVVTLPEKYTLDFCDQLVKSESEGFLYYADDVAKVLKEQGIEVKE